MLKKIKLNLTVMESMLYYWEATKDREKVGEAFIKAVAGAKEMKLTYDDDFDEESARRGLSAISNTEPFVPKNRNEGRFWNDNMWMLEDMDYMRAIMQPLKVLNLDSVIEEVNSKGDFGVEEVEVVFLPLHLKPYYTSSDTLLINFFCVKPEGVESAAPTDSNLDIDVEAREMIEMNDLKSFIASKLMELK
ncbi:hypothetical protein SAMN02745945_02287 [Peptoclostridium litorale DSM 5388]|uniref:Uncharacterized protein n=1 Tax=Peptoclostridium litorale DSM 5388 TaxID=1121324 RepID=A0A069RBI9_PEPLI|nr:hypothetical protein [Peptoclostridium litorale]KDR94444.1 hypothetical protein CLIT_20c00890 [Peptoclostridium litorale DSM 5388]SIO23795.1 hypothetical protein SAMN02745945_02287 [Peptoclostridium litorale DSM 5388]